MLNWQLFDRIREMNMRSESARAFPDEILMGDLRARFPEVVFNYRASIMPDQVTSVRIAADLPNGGMMHLHFGFDTRNPCTVAAFQRISDQVIQEFDALFARMRGHEHDQMSSDLGLIGSGQRTLSFEAGSSLLRPSAAREAMVRLHPLRSTFSGEAAADLEAVHGIRVADNVIRDSNIANSGVMSNAIAFGSNDVAQGVHSHAEGVNTVASGIDASWQRDEMERLASAVQARLVTHTTTPPPLIQGTNPISSISADVSRPAQIISVADEHLSIQQLVQLSTGPLTEEERNILANHMARLLGQTPVAPVPNAAGRQAAGTFGGRRLELDEQK